MILVKLKFILQKVAQDLRKKLNIFCVWKLSRKKQLNIVRVWNFLRKKKLNIFNF